MPGLTLCLSPTDIAEANQMRPIVLEARASSWPAE